MMLQLVLIVSAIINGALSQTSTTPAPTTLSYGNDGCIYLLYTWSPWYACTQACGGCGMSVRIRSYRSQGNNCTGLPLSYYYEQMPCNPQPCINGGECCTNYTLKVVSGAFACVNSAAAAASTTTTTLATTLTTPSTITTATSSITTPTTTTTTTTTTRTTTITTTTTPITTTTTTKTTTATSSTTTPSTTTTTTTRVEMWSIVSGSCPGSILAPSLVQQVVDQHNTDRSLIARGLQTKSTGGFAPTASNMYMLTWSCDLEAQAQVWANLCTFNHSSGSYRINAGENLYWVYGSGDMSSGTRMPGAAPAWWSEYLSFGPITDPNNLLTTAEFNLGIGHWSQMAWGSTTLIGCGFGSCTYSGSPAAYVVCQYRQPGNFLNEPIYDLGSPCAVDADCTTYANSHCSTSQGLCFL